MRIFIVNHEFPPVGGGAATAAREIAAGIASRGHQVRVLTGAFGGLPRRERVDGYEVFRLLTIRHSLHESTAAEILSFGILGLVPALAHFRRFRPQVCIAFFGVPSGIIALAARALWNVPYIVSLRGGDVPGFAGVGPFTNLALPIIYPIWKQASAVVANSPQLRELALVNASRIGRDVLYIPNGVKLESFRGHRGQKSRQEVHALFVGRLAVQKGLAILVQSLGLLSEREQAQLRLTLVGDGPLRSSLEESAARLAPGRVEFLGWQPRHKLPSIYAGADLLVLPSLMEGMPNVVLEAMAAGLAIVASNVGGSRELVRDGENGLLVEPGSPEALAAALSDAIGDRRRLAQWGRASEKLVEAYSWDRVVEQYLALADGAANRKGKPRFT